jgi:hypothetical protein
MCTAVALIAGTVDVGRLNEALAALDDRGYRRWAEPGSMPEPTGVLAAQERCYLLARAQCDCRTFLGSAVQEADDHDAAALRYRRKGWSEARVARALAERERSRARPNRRRTNEDADYWIDLLTGVADELALQRLGLVHYYSGTTEEPANGFVGRRDAGPMEQASAALAGMPEGVIHDFDRFSTAH